jgi:hypothetical protein
MVTLSSGKLQRGDDVSRLQVRVILQDFFPRSASSKKVENILHPDSQTTNAGTSPADPGVDRDSVQFAHISYRHFVWLAE